MCQALAMCQVRLVPRVVGFPGFEPAEGTEGESTGGTPTPIVGGFAVGEGPGDGRTTVGFEPETIIKRLDFITI